MRGQRLTVWMLLSLLALSGCGSASPVRQECPKLPEAPAEVMAPVEADFLTQMHDFLFGSPVKPTTQPDD